MGKESVATVRSNVLDKSFFTGVFVECRARPNVIGNEFASSKESGGIGALFILGSGGLVGKNAFSRYDLAPLMIFGSCHPLIKDNSFEAIAVDRAKQEEKETRMKELFRAELFKDDNYFYIVDGALSEEEQRDLILKGQQQQTNSN